MLGGECKHGYNHDKSDQTGDYLVGLVYKTGDLARTLPCAVS